MHGSSSNCKHYSLWRLLPGVYSVTGLMPFIFESSEVLKTMTPAATHHTVFVRTSPVLSASDRVVLFHTQRI
jgi:hypothetical protein